MVGAIPKERGSVERTQEMGRAGQLGRLEQMKHVLQRDDGGTAQMRGLGGVVEKLMALQRGQADTGRGVAAGAGATAAGTLAVRASTGEEDAAGWVGW